MAYFPFMQNIDGKSFLVVGAGRIALRKIRFILQFTDHITVITHHTDPAELTAGKEEEFSGIRILDREFLPEDLQNTDYCIASSDDKEDNRWIAQLCRWADIPVNVPDDPSQCTFFLPAAIVRGDLTIAVSTGGKSPVLSRYLRRTIEESIPADIEAVLDRMGELREWIPNQIPDSAQRKSIYSTVMQSLLNGQIAPAREEVESFTNHIIGRYKKQNNSND